LEDSVADVSLSDLGSSSNPLSGLDASDYEGFGSGGNISGVPGDPGSNSFLGSAGALGLGALGLGSLLAQGPGPLPGEFANLKYNAATMTDTGQGLTTQGQGLVSQGQSALAMAQRGELTPEQQAQVSQYGTGLTNQARQMYYNMGVSPDSNTSFLSTTADIDAKVNAMAQQQIQSTIQLGLGEISGGSSLIGQGLGFENAANQVLLQAGQAQLQQDKAYSDSLTSVFGSIAKLLPAVLAA
jgi:hypothetical protein